MKNLLFTAALFVANLGIAQEFQGMAVYESKATGNFTVKGGDNVDPDMQNMIQNSIKKSLEKTFVLNFDKSASVYKEEKKLDAPTQGVVIMNFMDNGGGTYYKNVKSKSYVADKELMGKEFLVKDSLSKLNWKLEGETKMIGEYKCFKATAVLPAKNFVISKKENSAKDKTADVVQKTSLMDNMEIPNEITITAWYTPEISVNQGPGIYWGLPGLILEVNDGKTVTLCSKVVLNTKEKTEIKAPTNGKVVSQKEYDEIAMKKMEEMREMNQGREGNGAIRMTIGG